MYRAEDFTIYFINMPANKLELCAHRAGPDQVAQDPVLALGQADEAPARFDLEAGHVVVGGLHPEPAADLVDRQVGPALDEPPELGRRAAGAGADSSLVDDRAGGSRQVEGGHDDRRWRVEHGFGPRRGIDRSVDRSAGLGPLGRDGTRRQGQVGPPGGSWAAPVARAVA
jgi:hypothetical protein